MKHISNYLLKWEQVIAKRNAEQINLSTLPRCGSCGTIVRQGLCNYCTEQKNAEGELDILVQLARQVVADSKINRNGTDKPRPEIACDVCGEVTKGYGDSYLIFKVDKTICNRCNQNVHK